MAGAQTLADLKSKKADFQNLDLPTLMMKIWTYSHMHNYCDGIVPGTYRSWCIDEPKTMWQDTWLDFDLVVEKLCSISSIKNLKEHYMTDIYSICLKSYF